MLISKTAYLSVPNRLSIIVGVARVAVDATTMTTDIVTAIIVQVIIITSIKTTVGLIFITLIMNIQVVFRLVTSTICISTPLRDLDGIVVTNMMAGRSSLLPCQG